MEKIIVWGTGNTYRWYRKFLKEHIEAGSIEIIAIVSRKNHDYLDGIKVIMPNKVKDYSYDTLVLCVCEKYREIVVNDIAKLNMGNIKMIDCSRYIKTIGFDTPRYKSIVKKQCTILTELLQARDEQVSSNKWMKAKICEYGVYPFEEIRDKDILWTQWGILQIIDEFTQFCVYISQQYVRDAIEIGVYKGRSSYFVCALLSRINPKIHYICVDVEDWMDSFEQYHAILPGIHKCIPSTSADFKDKRFDMVFIDADHSYDMAMLDYLHVGNKANKFTFFHDIYAHEYDFLNGGTVRLWKEVKNCTSKCKHNEFSKFPDKWMGIGMIEWNRQNIK